MDGNRPHHTLSDQDLDRELEAALGIEPSPQFLARVRTRVASEPERSRWRLGLTEPLFGLAIAGIVLALVVSEWRREDRPIAPVIHDAAGAQSPHASEGSASAHVREAGEPLSVTAATGAGAGKGPTRRVASEQLQALPAETPLRLSPVIFSEDERHALLTLVHAVEEGRLPPLPATAEATDRTAPMRELHIDPLVIEPLPVLARLEELGASQ